MTEFCPKHLRETHSKSSQTLYLGKTLHKESINENKLNNNNKKKMSMHKK